MPVLAPSVVASVFHLIDAALASSLPLGSRRRTLTYTLCRVGTSGGRLSSGEMRSAREMRPPVEMRPTREATGRARRTASARGGELLSRALVMTADELVLHFFFCGHDIQDLRGIFHVLDIYGKLIHGTKQLLR